MSRAEYKKLNDPLRVFIIKHHLPKRPYSEHLCKYVLREVCLYIENLCGPNLADSICLFKWKASVDACVSFD